MKRFAAIIAVFGLAACTNGNNVNAVVGDAGNTSNQSNNSTPDLGNGGDDGGNTTMDMGNNSTADMGGNTGGTNNTTDPEVVLINPDNCYGFSDDVDVPLALDGAFSASSPVWRRPHDDTPVCPATMLLPDTAALVPYLAVKFCNTDTVEHTYDFEWYGQDGPAGEAPIDDSFLVIYDGEGLPADARQCLAINDDAEGSLDPAFSEVLGLTVPAGGAVTVVGTTYTFDPTDGTGIGGYILIVTNAD